MHLSVVGAFHWIIVGGCVVMTGERIRYLFSLQSHFPDDIYEEIAVANFEKFNNETGSYQQIIPSVAHFLHPNEHGSELKFYEAAAALAAFHYGNFDTVFIHSFNGNLTGRYIEELKDLIKRDKLVINGMEPVTDFQGQSLEQGQEGNIFPLAALFSLGGVVLPPAAITLDNLDDLLKYECSRYSDPRNLYPNNTQIIMAHTCARIINAARDHFRLWGVPGGDPLARVGQTQPQLCHSFQSRVLEGDSPLLNSTQGRHLAEIISNRIVLLDRKHVQELTHESVAHMAGNIPALLRRAWYGSYLFA